MKRLLVVLTMFTMLAVSTAAPLRQPKDFTIPEATAIMDSWWREFRDAPSTVKIGGVDSWEVGGKAWGDQGMYYVGVWRGATKIDGGPGAYYISGGFTWYGRGSSIREAMYDAIMRGQVPMKWENDEWVTDDEAEKQFLKMIGRAPIKRGQ
jgi:hypothetical protein